LRLVEQRLSREALRQKRALPVEGIACLDDAAFGGRQRGLGGAQRVQFVLRVEPGQYLVRLDPIADIHQPLEDPAADAERERRLVFGADLSGEHHGLGRAAQFGGYCADGPRDYCLLFVLGRAAA
jgi:hypothetical protein